MKAIHPYFKNKHWDSNANVFYLLGQVYVDQTKVSPKALKESFLTNDYCAEEFCQKLNKLNGFYALVRQEDNCLFAAVDHIRSIPLFYGKNDVHFYISDDAEWVRQQVGDQEMDQLAREEFQLAGYVTGRDTLFPNVKQLQAGELLIAKEGNDDVDIKTHRYYRFLHNEPDSYNEEVLGEQLDQVAVDSIKRLIDYADGRQIVVPLSGGYDSRLIVTLLKRLEYDNILTFTYGVPGNKESVYSKKIADALGLEWHFVEYSNELWRNAWQTEERWQYQKWASGWASIAHVQDWLAVKLMKEEGVIDPDCVFVPGHSGDFVAGSHIPQKAFTQTSFSMGAVSDSLFADHYTLAPIKFVTKNNGFWKSRVESLLSDFVVSEAWQYADAYESWDWQERQAKFICNSVRVYEFFGYDWWMPLWDAEFMRFWEDVPLELRKRRHLGVVYVQREFSKLHNQEIMSAQSRDYFSLLCKVLARIRNIIIKYIPFVRPHIPKDHLARYSRFPAKKQGQLIDSGFTLVGIVCFFFLDDFSKSNEK